MIQNGTLLLVDDDSDDQEMITLALQDIGFRHEIVFFNNAESALNYLYAEKKKPFLIVSATDSVCISFDSGFSQLFTSRISIKSARVLSERQYI
jgi:CheY-like chemotaxis protein